MFASKFLQKKKRQGGFSIIELMVTIVIIGILISVIGPKLKTTNAKATAVLDNSNTISAALARFNADTGCYPVRIQALFNKADATGAATDTGFCTSDVSSSWREQYMDVVDFDAAANTLKMPKFGSGVTLKTSYDSTVTPAVWSVDITSLPTEVAETAVRTCNNQDIAATIPTAWASGTRCILTGGTLKYAFDRKN